MAGVRVAVMVATDVSADGYREDLGIHTATTESAAGSLAFFRDLVVPGLTGVAMVTSDAHTGLVEAVVPPCRPRPGNGAAPTTPPT